MVVKVQEVGLVPLPVRTLGSKYDKIKPWSKLKRPHECHVRMQSSSLVFEVTNHSGKKTGILQTKLQSLLSKILYTGFQFSLFVT